MNLQIDCVPAGPLAANCYIITNPERKECFIVDPGGNPERIMSHITHSPVAVLLTHGHSDHIGGVDALCGEYHIPLYIHEGDASKLTSAGENLSGAFGTSFTVQTAPALLRDGEILTLAGIPITVLHTPGHSAGSVCYLLPDGQGILTGDTFFAHGYGRTDFADGSYSDLVQSLRRLFHLTPKMTAYPGHDEPGIIGRDPEVG